MGLLTAAEMVERIKSQCASHPGGQKGWAKDHGVSPQYVNDILHERREVSQNMARKLGFERHIIFAFGGSSEDA